ncbi:MAG: hypothetical protein M5U12_14875 [Verrucomicrobia bacterium]|nr:hypothetical protein [Verrucomicrobiota bacterium]
MPIPGTEPVASEMVEAFGLRLRVVTLEKLILLRSASASKRYRNPEPAEIRGAEGRPI